MGDFAPGIAWAAVLWLLVFGQPRPSAPPALAELVMPPPAPEPRIPPLGPSRHEPGYCYLPLAGIAIPCREADAITGGERNV